MARPGLIGAFVVGLQSSHLALATPWQDLKQVPGPDAAGDWNAGQNRAKALGAEDTLDRHAKDTVSLTRSEGTGPLL